MKNFDKEKTLKVIFSDSVFTDRKVGDFSYSFNTYDDLDFLYLPKSNASKEKIFLALGEVTSENSYSGVEIDFANTFNVDYESVLEFFANFKREKIFEIKIDNSFESKLSKRAEELIEKFENLEILECESLSIDQFESLRKKIAFVLSNGEAMDFSGISEFCHPENNNVAGIGDGRMSLTNCLYSTNLKISRVFDIQRHIKEIETYLDVAENIEKIKFNFSRVGEREKRFIIDFCRLVRNHKGHISKKLNISISSDKDDQLFSYRELANLEEIQRLLSLNNFDLNFDSKYLYINKKLDEIKSASNIFNFQVSIIQNKDLNFSPYEKFLLCYYFTKQHTFGENPKSVMESRNTIDFINKKSGVCIAFSGLFSMFLERCGFKFINDQVLMKSKIEEISEDHLRTIFSLFDEKYGIDGVFIANPTIDAENIVDGDKNFLFVHTLLDSKLKRIEEYSKTPLVQLINTDRLQTEELLSKPVYLRKFVENLYALGRVKRSDPLYSVIDGYGISDFHVPYNVELIKNEKSSLSLGKNFTSDCLVALNRIKNENPIDIKTFANALERVLKIIKHSENVSGLVDVYVDHSAKEYKRIFEKGSKNTFSSEWGEGFPQESSK